MGNFVTSSRETSANCERVWAILADVDRWPDRFTPHLREAQLAGELAPGAEGWVRMKLPMPRSAFTVTEVDPGRSWAWRGKILWLDMHYNHLCEPSSGGCRVTFDVDLDGSAAGLVRPLGRVVYRRQMNRALDLLAVAAEAEA